ncbi:MAG: phosphatidylserine/phosphatidylglycerophosphate/cardiolipin synthase family protein [Bacteroidaceae bacterium]|nr:phosphatidylserine/phosphatidylglycerophosphate/cardiolipin synthase family protein [Bacteroidaceae bacterium]
MSRISVLLILLWAGFLSTFAQERPDSAAVRMLREDFGVEFTQGNTVRLFHTGQEKFDDLFHEVRRARSSIHLEYFNFRNDSISSLLFDLLASKAAQGVKVRAVFDGFGNSSNNRPLKANHLDALRRRGIEIVEYDRVRFPWINHAFYRDHRKFVVIDDSLAYVGGMNVADYYINGKEEFGDWRDIHMALTGPVVDQLQQIFVGFWNKVAEQRIDLEPERSPLAVAECDTDTAFKPLPLCAEDAMIGVTDRVPNMSPKIIRRTFLTLIDNAHTQIQLINPYFIPGRKIMRALKRALKRGVDVQIIVSDKSDIPVTPRVVERNVYRLMKRGAQVYMYTGGFHHSKVMMVDSCVAYVGSANLNARSLRHDYECNLLLCDRQSTAALQRVFETDKRERCYRLTPEVWRTYSRSRRFAGWFYQILTPFL